MIERIPLGNPLPIRANKGLWQALAEAFSDFMHALGLNF
jgi:hypothetical protein